MPEIRTTLRKSIMQTNKWCETPKEYVDSLIADEAKDGNILENISRCINQLKAKHTFRLALLNQLKEQINNERNQPR